MGGRATRNGAERRRCRRTRVHGEALAIFATGSDETLQTSEQTQRVSLLDASVGGIAVRTEIPVTVGATFTLFPDKVRKSSWAGSVVRCVHEGDGYTVGLQLAV